jgi:hypothetical protein
MMEDHVIKQCSKGERGKVAGTSKEMEDIQQDVQEDLTAGDEKLNNQVYSWATGNEELDIVDELAPSDSEIEMSQAQLS